MRAWQIGLATGMGALMLANPVKAANAPTLPPHATPAGWALLILGLAATAAISRRRKRPGWAG